MRLGLPQPLAAIWALAATVLVTGGLHEDGLADTADGFGGGRTAEAQAGDHARQPHRQLRGAGARLQPGLRLTALALAHRPAAALVLAGCSAAGRCCCRCCCCGRRAATGCGAASPAAGPLAAGLDRGRAGGWCQPGAGLAALCAGLGAGRPRAAADRRLHWRRVRRGGAGGRMRRPVRVVLDAPGLLGGRQVQLQRQLLQPRRRSGEGAPIIRSWPCWFSGNRITSRMFGSSASSMTMRSMPGAEPPCGGAP